MDKKEINELVKLYFLCNPQNNKGIGYRIKTNDIITSYANKHNMSYDDIKHCIESNPMCKEPIWEQFYKYWFSKNKKSSIKKEEKSEYKKSINTSTDVDDWI